MLVHAPPPHQDKSVGEKRERRVCGHPFGGQFPLTHTWAYQAPPHPHSLSHTRACTPFPSRLWKEGKRGRGQDMTAYDTRNKQFRLPPSPFSTKAKRQVHERKKRIGAGQRESSAPSLRLRMLILYCASAWRTLGSCLIAILLGYLFYSASVAPTAPSKSSLWPGM